MCESNAAEFEDVAGRVLALVMACSDHCHANPFNKLAFTALHHDHPLKPPRKSWWSDYHRVKPLGRAVIKVFVGDKHDIGFSGVTGRVRVLFTKKWVNQERVINVLHFKARVAQVRHAN
jgi:hypothetical protein